MLSLVKVPVLVTLAVVVCASSVAAAPREVGSQVLYSPKDGLVLVDAEDGSATALTDRANGGALSSWSPDGRRVAVARRTSETDTGIYALDVVTGEQVRLSPYGLGLNVAYPAWAPTGQRVAYGDNDGIWVHDLLAGVSQRVATGGGVNYQPVWSPDGSQVAFIRSVGVDGDSSVSSVWVVGVTPSTPPRRVQGTDDAGPVRWSPRGDEIAFAAQVGDSRHAMVLPTVGGVARDMGEAFDVQWSPDGSRLSVAASTGGGLSEIRVVDVASGSQVVVSEGVRPQAAPTWSPDGERLAYAVQGREADAGLHVVEAVAGGTSRQLTTAEGRDAVWRPGRVRRTAGATREETAVAVSRDGPQTSTAAVLIASGQSYADALAGAPLARVLDGPILLTGGSGLGAAALDEVARLDPGRAVILGGRAAVPENVEQQLRDAGITEVTRVAGRDRAETAAEIAALLADTQEAYLVLGYGSTPATGWPDAVAAAPVAALRRLPILLATTDSLPEATVAALDELDIERVIIVGGTAAVSPDVEQELRSLGVTVAERLAGADRTATSAAVATHALAHGASAEHVAIATSANWPDAVAAGPSVAASSGVLLLSGDTLGGATCEWLRDRIDEVHDVVLLGGPDVVPPTLAVDIERLTASSSCG